MAVVTKGDDREKPLPGDEEPDKQELARRKGDAAEENEDEGPEEAGRSAGRGSGGGKQPGGASGGSKEGGFFTIYKPGHGYWTRLFTGLTAAVLLAVICQFIWIN